MKYILLIFTFVVAQLSHATENNSLVIYLNSGTKIIFPVEDKPMITFEGNILCINTERYQITDVKKYTFSRNEEVSIQEVEDDKNNATFRVIDGERIAINAKDPSIDVHIYSSKGMEHNVNKENDADGNIVIDMAGLMPDIYIIAIGNETIKIRKR